MWEVGWDPSSGHVPLPDDPGVAPKEQGRGRGRTDACIVGV